MSKVFDSIKVSSETRFKMKQAEMSNEELVELVRKEISKLCETYGKSLQMSIPPQVTDTDMLLCEMLRRFKKLTEKL